MKLLPILVLAILVSVLASSAKGSFEPYVQIIGCSNSDQIAQAYLFASPLDKALDTAIPGDSLKQWADSSSDAWSGRLGHRIYPGFDANFATYGATAIWFPLCIHQDDYQNNSKAYSAFKTFVSLLRLRTSAPLYLSPTIGAQPDCPNDNQSQQTYVTDKAVAEGLALRGPDVPPALVPTDACHFDPTLSVNVQAVAVGFIDG